VPDLWFRVEGAEAVPFAAAPNLLFKLRVENRDAEPVRSITLNTQVRIEAARRHYAPGEQERLAELFGEPERWGTTLKSLLWTHTTLTVPAFTGSTLVELPIPCTYDFEVVSAKYLHGVEDGEIPLEFLFSGSVFYAGGVGLQVVQIPWDRTARFRLPARVWKEMMDQYFPNSAWLRLRRDLFDRLYAYRTRGGLGTWEETVERLLSAAEEGDR
jgi:hypothetical protein